MASTSTTTILNGQQPQPTNNDIFEFTGKVPHMHHLMRWLAQNHPEKLILSYPDAQGVYNVNLTGSDMERLTAFAASRYAEIFKQLPAGEVTGDPGFGGVETKIVALVHTSTFSSFITIVALQRLGLSTMVMSPRLADSGYAHLLRVTGARTVVAGASCLSMLRRVRDMCEEPLEIVSMLNDEETLAGLDAPHVELSDPLGCPGTIIHTGGTTGLPKPIAFPGPASLFSAPIDRPSVLCTVPNFHAYGLGVYICSLCHASHLFLLNVDRPVTAGIVWKALDTTGARSLYTVPYTLKFFADTDGGPERLAALDKVLVGGSATPDDLGDLLVRTGVNLFNAYGQTETGVALTPETSGLEGWQWLTPIPHTADFLRFEEVGDGLYHLVILAGFPTLKLSDRPDGSYGTKDVFRPHPDNLPGNDTRPGQAKWKFVGRQGDVIVLVNGENADASPIEQKVHLSPNVQMAVAFGAGHERVGLLVIPSDKAADMSPQEIVKSITPALESGNALVANYARISPDDIIVKPVGTPFPVTAKMTLQRHIVHEMFAEDIEAHYAEREQFNEGDVSLSDGDVRDLVRRIVEDEFHNRASLPSTADTANGEPHHDRAQIDQDTDFFSLGMDSLQASLVRRRLLREIPLPKGTRLPTNVMFNYPNLTLLSGHIESIRQSSKQNGSTVRDPETIATAMVKKYVDMVTVARDQANGVSAGDDEAAIEDSRHVIILTGATGSLGVQLLALLLRHPDVSRVYCLVRTREAQDNESATQRIRTALDNAFLCDDLKPANMAKLACLSANLAAADLGLSAAAYSEIKASVTSVIHNAWSVNFNMNLESFEPNIASVAHLLQLVQSNVNKNSNTKEESRPFVFISSVAAVGGVRGVHGAEERLYANFKEASPYNGYGQSKWAAEQIVAAASTSPRILRVGQISGDTQHGVWNPAEAVPATVQSALTVGALPRLEGQRNVLCWLPSDITAATIADLTMLPPTSSAGRQQDQQQVFHVASPHTLTWNEHVLSAIGKAGIEARIVPQREWVRMLERESDVEKNPPYKLIEHFRQSYGSFHELPDGPPSDETAEQDTVIAQLDLTQSLKASPSLKNSTPVDSALVEKYVRFWLSYWAGERGSHIKT